MEKVTCNIRSPMLQAHINYLEEVNSPMESHCSSWFNNICDGSWHPLNTFPDIKICFNCFQIYMHLTIYHHESFVTGLFVTSFHPYVLRFDTLSIVLHFVLRAADTLSSTLQHLPFPFPSEMCMVQWGHLVNLLVSGEFRIIMAFLTFPSTATTRSLCPCCCKCSCFWLSSITFRIKEIDFSLFF